MAAGRGRPELDGTRARIARDIDLRARFPHGSKTARPSGPADTPTKKLAVKVADLSEIVGKLTEALNVVASVRSDRGGPLVEDEGISSTYATAWITSLDSRRPGTG